MGKVFDRFLNFALVLATVVCAIVLVRRELQPSPVAPSSGPPEYVNAWRDVIPFAALSGLTDAPIQVVVFSDFECPFCRHFHEAVLPSLKAALTDSVALRVVHFPLPMHRFARPAARVFECGSRQAPVETMLDVLYAKQDSFGLKPWTSYGVDAGVRDTLTLQACLNNGSFERIDSGAAVSQRFGIRGTPGVMVNGYLFAMPPNDTQLVNFARLIVSNGGVLPDVRPAKRN